MNGGGMNPLLTSGPSAFAIMVLLAVPPGSGQAKDMGFAIQAPAPTFVDSGQTLGDHRTFGIAVGDIDGDGDIDAFVANYLGPSRVWTNDGHGLFTDSGQNVGHYEAHGVALGDLRKCAHIAERNFRHCVVQVR